MALGVLALVATGGGFYLVTSDDGDSDSADARSTGAPTREEYDPAAPLDGSDPEAVVTTFILATWAGDCDTAAALVTGQMWRDNSQTPHESCEHDYNNQDDVTELRNVELGYDDGNHAVVSATEAVIYRPNSDDSDIEGDISTADLDYILAWNGDTWLVAYSGFDIDLEANGLEHYFGDDIP